MRKKRRQKPGIAGNGDHAAPPPGKVEKKKPPRQEDKYAGWEGTFRRDRYGK